MGKGGYCMLSFFKRLFGKNKNVEQKKPESIKERPVVTPRPEELDRSTHAAAVTEAKKEVAEEEELTVTPEEPKKEVVSPVVEEKPKEEPKETEDDEPVYDIKTHPKGWQVILPGAQRATRVLDTQQEAIDYCRQNNYKFQVYKMDGTLKK